MSINSISNKEDYLNLDNKYKGEDISKILGPGAALGGFNKNKSGDRNILTIKHINQCVPVNKPEFPQIYTGYENELGLYTDYIEYTDNNYEVVDIIEKYPGSRFIYMLVLRNKDNGKFDTIEIKHYKSLTENFGFTKSILNSELELKQGYQLPKGSILTKSDVHDEHNNFMYGLNAKTVFISDPGVQEDAAIISKDFSERLSYTQINDVGITINKSDVLLNIFGDDTNPKIFPDIGEDFDDILAAKRTIMNKDMLITLNNKNLKNITLSDKSFYFGGKLIDIDVYVNDKEILENNKIFSQLNYYYRICYNYHSRIYGLLSSIISDKFFKHEPKLKFYYDRSFNFINEKILSRNNKEIFEVCRIEFKISQVKEAKAGDKIADKHGNKHIISKVVNNEDMPMTNGIPADIIVSPVSIPGRTNISQLYEHELTYIADKVRDIIKSTNNVDEKFKILCDFFSIISENQLNEIIYYYTNSDSKSKQEFWDGIENDKIYIRQGHIADKITLNILETLYNKYNIEPEYLDANIEYVKNRPHIKIKSEKRFIMGTKYFMLLQHFPENKGSVRALGEVNRFGIPNKNKRESENERYSSNPIKMSILGTIISLIKIPKEEVFRYFQVASTNPRLREIIVQNLTFNDPYWRNKINYSKKDSKDNEHDNIMIEVFSAYCNAIGIDLKTN